MKKGRAAKHEEMIMFRNGGRTKEHALEEDRKGEGEQTGAREKASRVVIDRDDDGRGDDERWQAGGKQPSAWAGEEYGTEFVLEERGRGAAHLAFPPNICALPPLPR